MLSEVTLHNYCNILKRKSISIRQGPSWSWSHGSWIYIYLCNQCCLSPLMLWVLIPLGWVVLHTTLCDKVCQWLAAGQWYSLDKMSNLYRWPSIDASYKFRLIWPSGFRGEDFWKSTNQKQELPIATMFVNGSGQN